jgi:hypothetical protein
MTFARRERALIAIAYFRSFSTTSWCRITCGVGILQPAHRVVLFPMWIVSNIATPSWHNLSAWAMNYAAFLLYPRLHGAATT